MSSSVTANASAERVPIASPEPLPGMVDAYRMAAAALSDMQRHRVNPTPAAYELWLAYHSDSNPLLTRRMNDALARGQAMTSAEITSLRERFELDGRLGGSGAQVEHYLDVSDGLHDAAHALVEHAAQGRTVIGAYAEVLSQSVAKLGAMPDIDESVRVISMLTTETLKVAERNRELREQLAVTSAKVDKLRRLLADERQASSTDQLTGLANRRVFNLRVKRALGKVSDEAGAATSLLLLDVDHFKNFNDTYGHSTGDLVLRLVGRLLVESIKGRDIAARYGGEEFGVLLIGADLADAAKVARQICVSLANKRFKVSSATEQGTGRVTISIGVAQLRKADTLAAVIDRADAALYGAKRAGRNRVATERDMLGE